MKRKYYLIILGILIFSFFVTFENKRVYTKDIEWVEGNQLEKITPWYGFDKPQLYIGEKIKIGIVDGPVSTTHNQTKSMNINTLMLNSDSTIADIEHGTSILGVITSDNNGPFKSMLSNDNVEIYNAVVLSNGYASQSDIIKALIWLKEQDIDIINISIDLKDYNPDLERVIKEITSSHIPILLSNGNGNYSNLDSSKLIDDYVWSTSQSGAKTVASTASLNLGGSKTPIGPERDNNKAGYYRHYHTNPRKNSKDHSFYGGPS